MSVDWLFVSRVGMAVRRSGARIESRHLDNESTCHWLRCRSRCDVLAVCCEEEALKRPADWSTLHPPSPLVLLPVCALCAAHSIVAPTHSRNSHWPQPRIKSCTGGRHTQRRDCVTRAELFFFYAPRPTSRTKKIEESVKWCNTTLHNLRYQTKRDENRHYFF